MPAADRVIGVIFFTVFGTVLLEVWDRRAPTGFGAFLVIAPCGIGFLVKALKVYRRKASALKLTDETPERRHANGIFHALSLGQ